MPAGLLVSSPVAERVGVDIWFFLSGIAMLIITAAILLRNFADRTDRTDETDRTDRADGTGRRKGGR